MYLELFLRSFLLGETVGNLIQQAPVAVREIQEALHQHGLGLLPHLPKSQSTNNTCILKQIDAKLESLSKIN